MKDYLKNLSAERCLNLKINMNTSELFNDYDSINPKQLFITYFGRIPNCIQLHNININKAEEWFSQNYKDNIIDCSYVVHGRNKLYLYDVYYVLFDDLLLYLNLDDSEATFLYRKTSYTLVQTIVNEMQKFKKRKIRRKPEIELLIAGSHGLTTKAMNIVSPKLLIEDNYNDDFIAVHQTILKRLQEKNDKGLVLLHGKPGTGKTSYIRYLITKTKKPVIFLPPNMAASITDPNLMSVLIDNPNSVFVIEDAENIIIDRNNSGSSSVSTLLNLADGLLSDCLNVQIICTFNTDISRVDNALIRKGRLIGKYEFLELEAKKAQALSNKLGFSSIINSPMTLAAVYNQNETEFSATTKKKTIGFI